MTKMKRDVWLKGLTWEKARDLAVDWYMPIFENDHKKIRELEKRIKELEEK